MLNVLEYTCKMCEEDMYTCLHGVLYIFHNKLTLFIVSKHMASPMSQKCILLQSKYSIASHYGPGIYFFQQVFTLATK